ncbi:trypsin-like serine peptidase [Nocardiopsis mangrovi]|uniref:Trypsin-like serine peptidase n=1 Tax=Nocardiopsis mangrovi TaxID=1179818 RepID=A0ABV9E5Q5_9ACTN
MTLACKVLGPLMAAVVAVAGAPSAIAAPTPPSSAHEVVHSTAAAGEDPRDMLAHWTPARMAAAQPLDSLLSGVARDLPLPAPQAIAPQAAPRPDSTGRRWTAGGKVTRTTGRVFLTMGGRDFTCSASVVSAGNKDTVVTAGHCLKDGTGAWARNWTFAPGYTDGDSPYGRYPAREMLVAPEWSERADDSFDFGFAVLGTDGGDHVQSRAGGQPIAFGGAPSGPVYAFGYPSAGGFQGRHLYYCSGSTRPDQGGTTANGMACAMTEGSSGGPWLSDFNTGKGTGTITSVVSFKYADDSRTQYGPRLGEEARALYRRAAAL